MKKVFFVVFSCLLPFVLPAKQNLTRIACIGNSFTYGFTLTDPLALHFNAKGGKELSDVVYQYITGDNGELKLADIFTDNMVLQCDMPVAIYGTAKTNSDVQISFNGMTKTVKAAPNGKWKIHLPALKASVVPKEMIIESDGQRIVIKNILIGDVWLASGQSNMYFPLKDATGGPAAAQSADSNQNLLRLFKYVPFAETDGKAWDAIALEKANTLDFFHGNWQMNTGAAAAGFSAVAYWFGKTVQQEIGVPVGIIELAVGGSPQLSWISRATLENEPLFEPVLSDWRNSDYVMQWCRERAALNLQNTTFKYQRHPYEPSFNFEAGVARLVDFPIKGVIWYQGESDAENPELFEKLFPFFVQDWRNHWGYNFPFFYVQLSSLNRPSWQLFRDVQRQLLDKVSNSGMVVSSDVGDRTDVHPRNKKPVGLRLAGLALNQVYKKKKFYPSGPMVKNVQRKGDKIEIKFLYAKGLKTSDDEPLRGFKIMDEKGDVSSIDANINGRKVNIVLKENTKVLKVMYGWEPFTTANLTNVAGLPASTFMMDIR